MASGEKHSLINNEEEKKEDFTFIENIFQKPTDFLKDAKRKICKWKICTKIPLSLCFFMIASLFLIVLLGSFFLTALFLMKSLYKEINDLYFTNFVIDPIINKKTNKTQVFNIRNEILDGIYLESKLSNLQIAIEFINDNFKNNTITDQMMNHITENNIFNSIRIDTERLSDGTKLSYSDSNKKETEKDYFIYESGEAIEGEFFNYNYNLFSTLTHYLRLIESNLNFYIFKKKYLSIKEIFIYNQDLINNNKILLTYCNDWDNENGLIEAIFKKDETLKSIINDINSRKDNYTINDEEFDEFKDFTSDFSEYIVRNDFQDKTKELNLMKFKTFNITYMGHTYNFLLGLRVDSTSLINLYNKQNSNMTTILPVSDFISDNFNISSFELHLLYDNKYFSDFFEYGIKNLLYSSELSINSQLSEEIDFLNTNIQTFFDILYYIEKENDKILYNDVWKNEFIIVGKLIKKIAGNIIEFDNLSCGEEEKDYNNIMCDIYNSLSISQSNISFGDIPNRADNDHIFYDLNKTATYIHQIINNIRRSSINYILIRNVFTDLEEKKSNLKIFYYNNTINNLVYHNIEVSNITTYNTVKEDFIKEMDDIEIIVTLIRIIFTLLFLIASLIKVIREVVNAIKRINSIISLKDMLFNKTESKCDEDKDDDLFNDKEKSDTQRSLESEKEEKEDLLEDEIDNDSISEEKKLTYEDILESEREKNRLREKWGKNHFYEDNFFPNGNKIIIKYTYNRLKTILENMDNCQNEKFAEKLVFLKRRYKLNEQNEDKEDCELSSDIYHAISKISLINMDDIYYNVYYNQSYALSQSFKMFKSILDSSINKQSIPQRNNKFINFGRILKIIYYFKKEKIQKIIEIIFDKDLKYKQKIKKNSSNDNIALVLKENKELPRQNYRKKTGHRKSFIQKGK